MDKQIAYAKKRYFIKTKNKIFFGLEFYKKSDYNNQPIQQMEGDFVLS